jgi:hypothetical protein
MKTAAAIANIKGILVPMALVFFSGCVNLDKPTAVAACSSSKDDPCFDGEKRDTAGANDDVKDANGDRTAADGRTAEDAAPDAVNAEKADASAPFGMEAGPDSPTPALIDAPQSDTRPAAYDTAVLPDTALPEVPRPEVPRPIDSQPGSPDVADTAPADLGPDLGPAVGLDAAPDLPSPDLPPVTTTTITFKAGRPVGTGLSGYGWVSLGSADSITSPKCGASGAAITAASPCLADIVWDSPSALCATGTIPSLTTSPDYAANWGMQIGTNLKDPMAAGGLAFKSIGVNVTGSPLTGLRLELHLYGDPAGTTYCALMTPGTLIPITKFNTQCWNDLGDALTEADAAKVDKIGVQVSSGSADIAVTELCLQSIVLGN